MKKVFMILGVFVVVVIVFFFIFLNSMKSEIKGHWQLTSTDDNCFTTFTFTDGPASNRGITFDETDGNTKTVYIGTHEAKEQQIVVKVDNFDVEPFEMTYTLKNDVLQVEYPWKNENYSCTYENID